MCRAKDNQYRFVVEAERCHARNAIAQKQASQGGDDVAQQATAWTAHLKQ